MQCVTRFDALTAVGWPLGGLQTGARCNMTGKASHFRLPRCPNDGSKLQSRCCLDDVDDESLEH